MSVGYQHVTQKPTCKSGTDMSVENRYVSREPTCQSETDMSVDKLKLTYVSVGKTCQLKTEMTIGNRRIRTRESYYREEYIWSKLKITGSGNVKC